MAVETLQQYLYTIFVCFGCMVVKASACFFFIGHSGRTKYYNGLHSVSESSCSRDTTILYIIFVCFGCMFVKASAWLFFFGCSGRT